MIYDDGIDLFEGIDVNMRVLKKELKFQTNVCNWWHDLLMMSMNLYNIAISNIKIADYRCIISGISKSEGINLL